MLTLEPKAQLGVCDVEMSVGPDYVNADEVLTADEYVAALRRAIAHLQRYADGFASEMAADRAAL